MSFVKALYGTIVTSDFTLPEGKVGFTETDHLYSEMERDGKVKLFKTKEEADKYEYKSSMQLFHESFKTLNPPEGETAQPSSLDFEKSAPVIIDGKPSNEIVKKDEEVVKKDEKGEKNKNLTDNK
jgi:hypothetical protein